MLLMIMVLRLFYAPYVCFSLKASKVTPLANLDYVRVISEYEEIVYPDEESSSDEQFFIEDPSRFEEKNTEGYPLDLSFDGTYWIHLEGWINGDIDRDGHVTASDARLALRASVNLWEPFICEQFYAADFDGNNRITSSDARSILRVSVGLD